MIPTDLSSNTLDRYAIQILFKNPINECKGARRTGLLWPATDKWKWSTVES